MTSPQGDFTSMLRKMRLKQDCASDSYGSPHAGAQWSKPNSHRASHVSLTSAGESQRSSDGSGHNPAAAGSCARDDSPLAASDPVYDVPRSHVFDRPRASPASLKVSSAQSRPTRQFPPTVRPQQDELPVYEVPRASGPGHVRFTTEEPVRHEAPANLNEQPLYDTPKPVLEHIYEDPQADAQNIYELPPRPSHQTAAPQVSNSSHVSDTRGSERGEQDQNDPRVGRDAGAGPRFQAFQVPAACGSQPPFKPIRRTKNVSNTAADEPVSSNRAPILSCTGPPTKPIQTKEDLNLGVVSKMYSDMIGKQLKSINLAVQVFQEAISKPRDSQELGVRMGAVAVCVYEIVYMCDALAAGSVHAQLTDLCELLLASVNQSVDIVQRPSSVAVLRTLAQSLSKVLQRASDVHAMFKQIYIT